MSQPPPQSELERSVRELVAAHRATPPPGPPWKLVSPSGVLFVIAGKEELNALVLAELGAENHHVNVYNMLCLLGAETGNTETPKHVHCWQPLSRLQFIKHKDSGEPLPVVGGMGRFGLEHFVNLYPRSSLTNNKGEVPRSLRDLLAGSYKSSKKFSNDWKGWSLVAPPPNVEQWLPRGQLQLVAQQACGELSDGSALSPGTCKSPKQKPGNKIGHGAKCDSLFARVAGAADPSSARGFIWLLRSCTRGDNPPAPCTAPSASKAHFCPRAKRRRWRGMAPFPEPALSLLASQAQPIPAPRADLSGSCGAAREVTPRPRPAPRPQPPKPTFVRVQKDGGGAEWRHFAS